MKRLNNKGFTLVELLAVIIILAVVVGITIPAVLSTVNGAKESAFKTASKTAADWFDRQYQAYMIGNDSISPVDANFRKYCNVSVLDADGDGRFNCKLDVGDTDITHEDAALISAAGLDKNNIGWIKIMFYNGRACVMLTNADGGDYITGNYVAESKSIAGGSCEALAAVDTDGGYTPGIYAKGDEEYKIKSTKK